MNKFRKTLCVLLCLALFASVALPMGAFAADEQRTATIRFVEKDMKLVENVEVKIPTGYYEMGVNELKEYVPVGYELIDETTGIVFYEKSPFAYVLVNKVPEVETRDLTIRYTTGGSNVVEDVKIQIPVGEYTLTAEEMNAHMPEGYALTTNDELKVSEKANMVYVLVSKIEVPAPANKNVPIKFMTDGTTVVGTCEVTVAEGETLTLNAAALAVLAPEGYELVNKDQSVKVTFNTAEVRVLVSKIEVPAPANKNVPIKFMTDGTTVVGTREVTVAEGEEVVLNGAALAVLAPEGYELVNKDQSVKVNFNTKEVRVLVSQVVVPTEPTVPEETKPEETKPEETKPVETKPEETKPEETKPVETKPEESKPVETKPAATEGKTPNTGDASHAMTWVLLLTVSAVCAACAFFFLKKGNANR